MIQNTTRTTPVIEVDSLTKTHGSVRAVDDLSFAVHPGRVTGFLSANVAGKTTTMRMILGLEEPTTGTPASELSAFDVVTTSLLGIDTAALVVTVLVASTVASEQATGPNRIVLLAAPRRGRRLAASALVVAGIGGETALPALASGLVLVAWAVAAAGAAHLVTRRRSW